MSLWYCPKCADVRGPGVVTGVCWNCGGPMQIASFVPMERATADPAIGKPVEWQPEIGSASENDPL